MTVALYAGAAFVLAGSAILGIMRISMWLTDRKEVSNSQSWVDSAHAGGDGHPIYSDSGFGDGGGGD